MKAKLTLLAIMSLLLLVPTVNATPPQITNLEYGLQGWIDSVPGEGCRILGEFWNKGFQSKSQVMVQVTLYDSDGAVIDTIEAMVKPTIIEPNARAGFELIYETTETTETVAEAKFKVTGYQETQKLNFQYLELADISVGETGIQGIMKNKHDTIYTSETEIIVTFYNPEGQVVYVQSYLFNLGDRFEAGETQQVFIGSGEPFSSYSVLTQCNRATINPLLRLSIEREDPTISWTPMVDETITLTLTDVPHSARGAVTAVLTDPNGQESTYTFNPVDQNYKTPFTATMGGTWNLTWMTVSYFMEGDLVYVEPAQLGAAFFVYDPDQSTENSTEVTEDDVSKDLNLTSENVKPPVATQQTEEETTNKGIPGYPITALVTGMASLVLIKRKQRA